MCCFFFAPSTSPPFPCLICNDYVIRAARQKGGATIISERDQAEITRSPSYSCHGNETSKNTGCHCFKKYRRKMAQDFSPLSLLLFFHTPPSPSFSLHLSFYKKIFKALRSGGEQFTFTPSVFQSLLFLNIFRIINSLLNAFASFWYSFWVGGLFPLILMWLHPIYKAHQGTKPSHPFTTTFC